MVASDGPIIISVQMIPWIWMNPPSPLCNQHLDQKPSRIRTCSYLGLGSTLTIRWLSVWSATLLFPQKVYMTIYGYLDIMKGGTFRKIKDQPLLPGNSVNQLVDHHHLNIPPPRPPTTITPAIPGLTVCTDMMICSQCGYAACTKKAVHWHQITKGCTQGKIRKGPAQTFIASSHCCYFWVKLPLNSTPSPMDQAATLFQRQFASDPYETTPIQAATHPHETSGNTLLVYSRSESYIESVAICSAPQTERLFCSALERMSLFCHQTYCAQWGTN